MKFARTVCGDIQAEEMGFTYPHEHLYAVPPTCQKDRDLEVSDYEGSVAELKLFKSVGGQTLVEALSCQQIRFHLPRIHSLPVYHQSHHHNVKLLFPVT